jgi:hypothetical protein
MYHRIINGQRRERVAGRRGVGDIAAQRASDLDLHAADRRTGIDEYWKLLLNGGVILKLPVADERSDS